jgi:class 3 adenylate cyclase/pimeloyl-ACP methyl ester carboxylesterase
MTAAGWVEAFPIALPRRQEEARPSPVVEAPAAIAAPPPTRYARSGQMHIAYQTVGEGPIDLVFLPGIVSNVELAWEEPHWADFYEQLASFSRLILFDRRGVGLSDRISGVPSLEERMEDVRAVLDEVGSERAALFGSLDAGAMFALFAATYPERVAGLVLFATQPRWTSAPGYPWGLSSEQASLWIEEGERRFGDPEYVKGLLCQFCPSTRTDPRLLAAMTKIWRHSASPGALAAFRRMNLEIDIRQVLPTIRVPTLVLQRADDKFVPAPVGRYVAGQIPGAVYDEVPGGDVVPWLGDSRRIVDSVGEFLGEVWEERAWEEAEPDRQLSTVMFTDIVDSTERAARLGDARWRELLREHHTIVRRQLVRFRGREVDTSGDGFFATFDGPARAIRCACAVRQALADVGMTVRAGLHTGECELSEGKVGGIAVHIGARVAAHARPGQVLVSRTVKDLVAGSGIAFDERGPHELRGIPGEWPLYAVQA